MSTERASAVHAALRDRGRLRSIRRSGLSPNGGDAALDQLTQLAAQMLDVETVMLSLVDDERQFFPSNVGLSQPWSATGSTPLSHSYCQNVVITGDDFVVANSSNDERVRSNLGTTEMGVVCYAGVPVRDPDGRVLGSFCALGSEPHDWDRSEIDRLRSFADIVEVLIADRIRAFEVNAQLANERMSRDFESRIVELLGAANRAETVQAVINEVVGRGSTAVGSAVMSFAVREGDELVYTHGPGVSLPIADRWLRTALDIDVPMAAAVRTMETIHLPDRESFATFPKFVKEADALGIESFRAVPFSDDSVDFHGVLGIGWATSMNEDDVPDTVSRLVELAVQSLYRSGRFENERHHARLLERMVLPTSLPSSEVFELAGEYLPPVAGQRVGGDVYDAVRRADGAIGVLVADAVGHDLAATRVAARLRHAVGVLILEGHEPAHVLDIANQYMLAADGGKHITCAVLLFDASGASVTVANAGHPQPLMLGLDCSEFIGPVGNQLLGRSPFSYVQETIELDPSAVVLAYTDGLIDRRSRSILMGERWLRDLLDTEGKFLRGPGAAPGFAERVRQDVSHWAGEDDIAFLVVGAAAAGTPGRTLTIEVAASQVELAEFRRQIGDWVDTSGRDIERGDLMLVATELLTNGREASPSPEARVRMELRLDGDGVVITVAATSPMFSVPLVMPDTSSVRGRGLAIVRALSEYVTVSESAGYTRVSARFAARSIRPLD